jgi:pimeloyl-ACP methyl ester carboxylesterase
MYVERYGAGPRLWLGLHGWSGDHRTFEPLARYLPEGVALYAPDLPGCGKSPPPGSWTLASILRQLLDLVARLATPPMVVIGNCSGAILALCLAQQLRRQGRSGAIERLVLIDPFAYWPWYFRVFASPRIGRYAFACSFGNPVGRRLINLALVSKRRADTDLTEGFAGVSTDVALAWLRILREIETVHVFADLDLPVRILHGARTFDAVRRSLHVFRKMWPQLEVRVIEGAGHLPLREAPQQVAASIESEAV